VPATHLLRNTGLILENQVWGKTIFVQICPQWVLYVVITEVSRHKNRCNYYNVHLFHHLDSYLQFSSDKKASSNPLGLPNVSQSLATNPSHLAAAQVKIYHCFSFNVFEKISLRNSIPPKQKGLVVVLCYQ